jgi:hypothetical protein
MEMGVDDAGAESKKHKDTPSETQSPDVSQATSNKSDKQPLSDPWHPHSTPSGICSANNPNYSLNPRHTHTITSIQHTRQERKTEHKLHLTDHTPLRTHPGTLASPPTNTSTYRTGGCAVRAMASATATATATATVYYSS